LSHNLEGKPFDLQTKQFVVRKITDCITHATVNLWTAFLNITFSGYLIPI